MIIVQLLPTQWLQMMNKHPRRSLQLLPRRVRIGLTMVQKVETFAYDGKFRRTRGDGGGGGCLSPLPEEIIFPAYFLFYFKSLFLTFLKYQ